MELTAINKFLNKIAKLADFSEQDIKILSTPQHVWQAELDVSGKKYPAYRVQWNNSRGPFKGGIRFHPEVDVKEVGSLAFWMSLKTAVADIPLGGGKGGVQVNPKELSSEELQELSRAFVRAFHEYIGPEKDIPAPDVYTTPQIMTWMRDEYEKIVGHPAPGVITGKPLDKGGSQLRDIATALGGVFILEEAVKKLNLNSKKVAIQGFGNAGMNAAKLLAERGYKVVAVSDSRGAVYNENGLNVDELIKTKKNGDSVGDYSEGEKITNQKLLELAVDILIPSALGGVITLNNAEKIKAKIILELANGPITLEADEVLHKKNIFVIPDILANSGGVTVSYFEWVQNQNDESWDKETVQERLAGKMVNAFDKLWQAHQGKDYTFRTTCYIYAMQKILTAEKSRKN